MFDITKEVPSLKLCKKLKKLGFPQEGEGWYYTKMMGDIDYRLQLFLGGSPLQAQNVLDFIKAPTCRELAEWINIAYQNLPVEIKTKCRFPYAPDEINPNILAEDLIWLIEKRYFKFK